MKRLLIVLLSGLCSLTLGLHLAYAETRGAIGNEGWVFQEEGIPMMPPRGHPGTGVMEAENPVWRHLMDLGLDEKQDEAIKKIKSRVTKDNIRRRADIELADVDLRDILDKDSVDLHAAEGKLKSIESLLADIRISHIKAVEEIKAILTPEQKNKFKKLPERRPGRGDMMHGGIRMPPFPPEK